jgi:NADPH:quinone reductase-like Zn-dependent oxidoreductase
MKASYLEQHGGPEVLKYGDRPDPVAGAGEIVVDIVAASVNAADWKARAGGYGPMKFPYILGRDFSGVVSAVGPGVTDLKVGDEVFAVLPGGQEGTYAEKVAVKADLVAKKPATLSHVNAAALALIGLTAINSVEDTLKLKRGETILVTGGAGGVASFAIQFAKHLGAKVITTTSAPNIGYVKSLGADEVIDYTKADFSKWAVERYGKPQRRTYEGGVEVVINFTGGDTWLPSLRCLKRGGKLLVCGATAGYDPKEDLRYVWSFELQIIGSNSFYDDNLSALMEMIKDGRMKPVIDKVVPLEGAAEALRLIQDRKVIGKVIVEP